MEREGSRPARTGRRIGDAFFTLDGEWRFTYVSRGAEALLRRDRRDLIGRSIWDELVPTQTRGQDLRDAMLRAQVERTAGKAQAYCASHDTWLELRTYPAGEGLWAYVVGLPGRQDVSEMARLLLHGSARLHGVQDVAGIVSELFDLAVPALADYSAVDVLAAGGVLRRVGVRRSGGAATELTEAFLRCGADAPADHPVEQVLRSGRAVRIVDPALLSADALKRDPAHLDAVRVLRPASVLIVPLAVPERVLGVWLLAREEPGEAYAEEDLLLAEVVAGHAAAALENAERIGAADAATRAREELLTTVSHDLRNPLNLLLSGADLLRQSLPADAGGARAHRLLRVMRRSAEQMDRLVRDLLDTASVEAGQLSLKPAAEPVLPLIEEMARLFEPVATERGIRLRFELREPLPAVYMDRGRIVQVLSNLLANALKFTPEGGAVLLRAERSRDAVCVSVQDTGPGIRPEELPRVFERFWRAQGSVQAGTGLGLAIARRIVEAHGGRIWVESRPGAGSTFRFTVPLAAEDG